MNYLETRSRGESEEVISVKIRERAHWDYWDAFYEDITGFIKHAALCHPAMLLFGLVWLTKSIKTGFLP